MAGQDRKGRKEKTAMAEDRPFKHGVDDVQKHEENRRDTYGPDHGSGDPHTNLG
jgi:hypothetical protein